MADLIDRQAAIYAICEGYCGGRYGCEFYPHCANLTPIQNLPSAQPEIVRCKDCRHFGKDDYPYTLCHRIAEAVEWDDYCSYGERKDE